MESILISDGMVEIEVMFARKVRVECDEQRTRLPCPLKWLDSFSTRNFTNFTVFDEALPVGEGEMEIGSRVPLDELRSSMEDWFHREGYVPKGSHLTVSEK